MWEAFSFSPLWDTSDGGKGHGTVSKWYSMTPLRPRTLFLSIVSPSHWYLNAESLLDWDNMSLKMLQ